VVFRTPRSDRVQGEALNESYESASLDASELKLKAMRMAVAGREQFAISCVLHAASRAERFALSLISRPPAETQMLSLVEQCGCWINAKAPRWAEMAWRQLVAIGPVAGANFARSVTASIVAPYLEQQARWTAALTQVPNFTALMKRDTFAPASSEEADLVRPEVANLLQAFPGDIHLWYALYRVESVANRRVVALEMLWRTHQLDPTEQRVAGIYLSVLSTVPEMREVFEHKIDEYEGSIREADFEFLVMYSLLVLGLARTDTTGRAKRLELAERAIAEAQQRNEKADYMLGDLECAVWVLHELKNGRSATVGDLIAAGLVPAHEAGPINDDTDALAFVVSRTRPRMEARGLWRAAA
jgi:hypothetical protein